MLPSLSSVNVLSGAELLDSTDPLCTSAFSLDFSKVPLKDLSETQLEVLFPPIPDTFPSLLPHMDLGILSVQTRSPSQAARELRWVMNVSHI